MKKGEYYSLKFPYMYYTYEGWDYWTGKYLILEGLGTQTIEGTDFHTNNVRATPSLSANTAEIRANSTLAKLEVSSMGAYYLENQKFSRAYTDEDPVEITPTTGFVLANISGSSLPQRIASIDLMSGEVTYEPEDGNQNTTTSTPTISGDRHMLVYTTADGLGIVPVVAQQVSIYNTSGQLVFHEYLTADTRVSLPHGIYLVRGEKDQAKAIVN